MIKKILGYVLLLAVMSTTGCLKDEKYMAIDETGAVVEFPVGGPGVVNNVLDVTPFLGTSLDTSIAINIASPQVLDRDVQVTVQLTPTIITDYNTNNGTTYTPLPLANYRIENYTVTIPKGYRIGRLPIRFALTQLDLSKSYAIAMQIVRVSAGLTISGNFNKFLWSLSVKNQYDGYYQTKGAAFHPTYSNYTWDSQGVFACGDGFSLVTSGANSVDLIPGQPLFTAGSLTYFSAVLPRFTVNTTTNKVSITSTNTTVFVQYPTYDSRYDPATKTFYVKYGWSGDRVATDTFTYCGPR
jgi:hypothetical protein